MKKYILLFMLFSSLYLFGQNQISHRIDWEMSKIEIIIKAPLITDYGVLPNQKREAERKSDQDLILYLNTALNNMTIDSWIRYEELTKEDPSLLRKLEGIKGNIVKESSRLLSDFSALEIKYSLDLFPSISRLFAPKESYRPQNYKVRWTPSREYTGLVIYVKEELPRFGKGTTSRLTPCLFPKLYDQKGRLFFSPAMADEKTAAEIGLAAYAKSWDEEKYRDRIGKTPLFAIATALFGKNDTDLVLPHRTTAVLYQNNGLLDIIRQGKVLIVYEGLE